MIRILVTAFGAFPGARTNPTMAIATTLERRRRVLRGAGIEIECAVLPVVFAGMRERLDELIAARRPNVVLHLGLAGRRKAISVETRAHNRLTTLHPDAGRQVAGTAMVERGGPFFRQSRFSAGRLVRTIEQAGAPAHVSIDAGDYLCNQVLYLSLGMHNLTCGFIHVPRPRRLRAPGGVTGSAGKPPPRRARPTLATLARAIEVAVRQLAVDARLRR